MKFLLLALSFALTFNSGAKELFVSQLDSASAQTSNLGLAYWIELNRGGKTYKVDNRFSFASGDDIRFHVRPNVDGFMYIVLDSAKGGSPTVMFPRPGDEANTVAKGKWMTIPAEGTLAFDHVPGVESLKLVLSQKRLEVKPDKIGRSVVIHEKPGLKFPQHFMIDFASIQPEQRELKTGDDAAASTMVSTDVQKPLVVDLLLRHEGNSTGATVAGGNKLEGSSPVRDKWAVVVGISNFKNPRWNLNYANKDAKDFASFLVQKCNFAPDHVKVLTDAEATRERVLDNIAQHWLPLNAKQEDLVCIYFATHGTSPTLDTGAVPSSFLMCHDTDPVRAYTTGIEISELDKQMFRRLKSQRVVLILDTCHSGAVEEGSKAFPTGGDITQLLQGTGHVIIASAGPNQTAHDSARYKNGIFTKHLIDGFSKYEKLNDAFSYVRTAVQQESLADYKDPQTPVLKDAQWHGVDLKLAVPAVAPAKPFDVNE